MIEGRKTAKVDGGYDGGKYIKKKYNFAMTCKIWWRGKGLAVCNAVFRIVSLSTPPPFIDSLRPGVCSVSISSCKAR